MILNIKDYVAEQKKKLSEAISNLYRTPRLLIIQIGDDAASNSYIKGKIKDATQIGIIADLCKFSRIDEMVDYMMLPTAHKKYDGIIIQEPSYMSDETRKTVLDRIDPVKDVDGFLKNSMHIPCTPAGILGILDEFYGDIAGANIVVVGRGELVGKPLVPLLIDRQATVTSCNSKTKNLQEIVEKADIIITAAGCRDLITELPHTEDHQYYVIDAGINFDDDNKLCGDCSKDLYEQDNVFITSVPGGVGLTTRLALMQNVVNAATFFEEEDKKIGLFNEEDRKIGLL